MVSRILAVGFAMLSAGADALAQQRPAVRNVSGVRIANYGAPSVLLQKRDEFQDIVEEANSLRRKEWRRGDTALNCYSTLIFMSGQRRVAELRVRPDMVVERPVEKGQSAYTLLVEPADIARISEHLKKAAPPVCK
jgi:hypothetical protein